MSNTPLSRSLQQNLLLKKHLDDLGELLGRTVRREELGTLEQTEVIRQASQKFTNLPVTSQEVAFSDRGSDRFRKFIQKLNDANGSAVFVWTPYTIHSGVLLVPSLSSVRFDFDFAINEDGILVFTTNDLSDKLLLDFFTNDSGRQSLKIETQGEHWARIIY